MRQLSFSSYRMGGVPYPELNRSGIIPKLLYPGQRVTLRG